MKVWFQVMNLLAIVVLSFSAGYLTQTAQASSLSTPTGALTAVIGSNTVQEQLSPQDWVKEEDIRVYKDRVEIRLNNPVWARFADTNSMDPVLDFGSNGIEIPVTDQEILMPGDVVTYKSKLTEGTIIHRIIFKGVDDKGTYYIVQGDNLDKPDPEKLYANENRIENVLVGIIY